MIDDDMTGRLLRVGGMREDVPPAREARVKRAFLDECRAVAQARTVRRRLSGAAVLLAIAAAVLVAVRVGRPREIVAPAAPIVSPIVATVVTPIGGTVERLEGDVSRRDASGAATPGAAALADTAAPIALGDRVRLGDQIEAGATGRVSVRLTNGASARFDRASRARLVSADRLELDAGAIYVDSGPASPRLEIVTPYGLVRNIGTQFEVRLRDASLRVRVRSGIVEVHRGAEVASARPGTELTLGPGQATSRTVAPYGEDWTWVEHLAPAFEIEGRSLAAFLEHVCREQGWTLAYSDPQLARDSSGIMLHGSTAGLQPSDALAVVMKTSGLTYQIVDGELTVARSVRP